jgi:hypothetical protein
MDSNFFDELGEQSRSLICSSAIRFAECNSYVELYNALQTTLVFLLRVDGIFITFFNDMPSSTRVAVKSGSLKTISPNLSIQFKRLIVNNSARYVASPGITVVISGDVPPQKLTDNSNDIFLNNFKVIAGVFDTPMPSIGLWVYRKNGNSEIFSQHEVNILKYMRPIIIQAIKSVSYQEEKIAYKKVSEYFMTSNIPKAVINNNGSVLVNNEQFLKQMGGGR